MGLLDKLRAMTASPATVADPALPKGVGFISQSDMLVIVGILNEEWEADRELADHSPVWMAQAQMLERVLPILKQAEIIVIE